ncbi:MAG: hypothetical protein ABIF71_04930 [Planctomycetota bacterium]
MTRHVITAMGIVCMALAAGCGGGGGRPQPLEAQYPIDGDVDMSRFSGVVEDDLTFIDINTFAVVKTTHMKYVIRNDDRDLYVAVEWTDDTFQADYTSAGQPFADDLAAATLTPHAAVYRRGAEIMTGHSILARYADYPYTGPAAAADFPDVKKRNAFFAAVGALPPLGRAGAEDLARMGPAKALDQLRQAAGRAM